MIFPSSRPDYHSNIAAPEMNPAPNALSASLSPLLNSPFLLHSSRRIGQLAEDELPWLSTFVGNFSSGCPRKLRMELMMRMFA